MLRQKSSDQIKAKHFVQVKMAPGSQSANRLAQNKSSVVPLIRALSILSSFTPTEPWLCNRDFVARTELAPSTVSRIVHTLLRLGYLKYNPIHRTYGLSASVLGLGYAATAHSEIKSHLLVRLTKPLKKYKLRVLVAVKHGQDMLVIDSWEDEPTSMPLLDVGMKVRIPSTPIGWALLSTMPITERNQLITSMDHHGHREWSLLRNHAEKAIMQIHDRGFYSSVEESDAEIGIITSPLNLQGSEPFVITLMALTSELTKAKFEREIGPYLVSVIHALQTLHGKKMMKMLKQKRLERR